MKKFKYLFYFIAIILSFFAFSWFNQVSAKSYSLQNQSTYVAFYPSTQTQTINWNQLYYLSTTGQSLYQWQFQVEILPTTLETSVLYPGRYLVEMYIYGVGQFSNLSCDYLSSNFSNVNMTTGSWVSNEISSSCIGVYKTTYKGYTAQRMLFEFTYKGDNYSSSSAINEIRFYVGSGNGSITSIGSGMNYGVNIGNIEDYDSTIVDSFNDDKNQQTQINQNDTIINQNDTIINNQEQINSSINNSNVDNPSNAFSEFESYLPENGVITQLITLPISLFQRVLSSINGTCSQYNLGNLLGTDLILPCINISNYLGTTLWNVIDILFSGLFVLVIGKKMIKVFNNFSSMEEGDVLD